MMAGVTVEDVLDHQLKHFSEYMALECRVKGLEELVNLLWREIVYRTGEMNLKGDWYGLDRRLCMLEEGEEGMRNFLSNSLKEKKTIKKTNIYKYK